MRLILALAMALIVVAGTSTTNADVLLTGTNASFNFDTDGTGDEFSLIADPARGNALSSIEAWVRYDTDPLDTFAPIVTKLSGASAFGIDGVAFSDVTVLGDNPTNPRTITPVLRFTLVELDDETARLDYSLELTGSNFSGGNSIEVDAFVSFDFRGTGADGVHTIGAAAGDLAIFDTNNSSDGPGLFGLENVTGSDVVASSFDVFNRGFGFPSANRFDTTDDLALTGSNLALGHYLSFGTVPTAVDATGFMVSGSASLGAAVPEPSTATLLLLGVAGFFCRRSRS